MHIRYRLALADTFSLISLSACRQRTQAFAFVTRSSLRRSFTRLMT